MTDRRMGTLLRMRYRSVMRRFGTLPIPSRRHDEAAQAAWTAVAERARELVAAERDQREERA